MATWLKSSVVANDTTTKMAVSGGMAQIETAYGKMIGSEVIRVVQIAPSMLRAYVLVKYERGPAFFTFDCYKMNGEWSVFFLDFNTKPSVALPTDILTGSR